MRNDKRIVLITADLGYGIFDSIRNDFPDRFFNVGAAEVTAVGCAVGMALSGRIPFVYSITPFLLWRAAEVIRNYVNHESVPVKMIGSGRDGDYKDDGFSHYAGDDSDIIECWPNIKSYWPETAGEMAGILNQSVSDNSPYYINLKR